MKRFVIIVGALVTALMVLAASLFNQAGMMGYGRTNSGMVEVEYSTKSAVMADQALPYPGLLPDSPLYLVKMMRDRLRVWMTINPLAKVRLYKQLGDKRAGAAYYLALGKQIGLAQATLTKAYQYLNIAAAELQKLDPDEPEVIDTWQELARSLEAHIRVGDLVASMVEGDARVNFERIGENYRVLSLKIQSMTGEDVLEEKEAELELQAEPTGSPMMEEGFF